MRRKGFYIIISVFLIVLSQSVFASRSKHVSSHLSNKFSTQGQSVLLSVSESTGIIFCTETELDLANLAFIDFDNDYEDSSSLLKKITVDKGFFNKNTESVVVLLHSYARGKYQFPYLNFSSSPRFIALRAIII